MTDARSRSAASIVAGTAAGVSAFAALAWLARRPRGVLSYRSPWSALSAVSLFSIGSAASVLSIGSFASVLSIGSSASVLSIGSDGGFLSIGTSSLARSEWGRRTEARAVSARAGMLNAPPV